MLVNKCDNCKKELSPTEDPDWIHITAQNGIIITRINKGATKFPSLDFCCSACAEAFFVTISSTIDQAVEEARNSS